MRHINVTSVEIGNKHALIMTYKIKENPKECLSNN